MLIYLRVGRWSWVIQAHGHQTIYTKWLSREEVRGLGRALCPQLGITSARERPVSCSWEWPAEDTDFWWLLHRNEYGPQGSTLQAPTAQLFCFCLQMYEINSNFRIHSALLKLAEQLLGSGSYYYWVSSNNCATRWHGKHPRWWPPEECFYVTS